MNLVDRIKTWVFNRTQFALALFKGYCSQDGQDQWVIETMFHRMRGGYFVDIGAYDGWRSSNSYTLEKKYGWKGICIEPNPRLFERLKKVRHCVCLDVCVADRDRDVLFTLDADAWGGMPEYYPKNRSKEIGHYWHRDRLYKEDGSLQTVTRKAESLETILRHAEAPHLIDYLSIDTEGAEYAILKDFPFNAYTFLTITVEHFGSPEHRTQLRTLLTSNGYSLEKEGVIDDYYSHSLLQERLH